MVLWTWGLHGLLVFALVGCFDYLVCVSRWALVVMFSDC